MKIARVLKRQRRADAEEERQERKRAPRAKVPSVLPRSTTRRQRVPKPKWSAYLFFVHENRSRVRKYIRERQQMKGGDDTERTTKPIQPKAIAKELLRRWHRLPPDQIQLYREMAQNDIDRYENQMRLFKEELSTQCINEAPLLVKDDAKVDVANSDGGIPTKSASEKISLQDLPVDRSKTRVPTPLSTDTFTKDDEQHSDVSSSDSDEIENPEEARNECVDGVDVFTKHRSVLGNDGQLRVVEAEMRVLVPLRPKPEVKPLNFSRFLPNRSCVASDERPLMPALRKQYVDTGHEFKEILLNRDFDTSDPSYRRMLTGCCDDLNRGDGQAYVDNTSKVRDKPPRANKLDQKTKRDDQIIWHKSCPLRKVQITRGGYFIGGGWFVVTIFGVGMNGRIFTLGSNAPRYVLIEAYYPETSQLYDLRIEMNELPGLLGDLPRCALENDMRRLGLNSSALADPSILVPIRMEPNEHDDGAVLKTTLDKNEDIAQTAVERSVVAPAGLKAKDSVPISLPSNPTLIDSKEAFENQDRERVKCLKIGVHREGALNEVASVRHFRRGRFQLWKAPTQRRQALIATNQPDDEEDAGIVIADSNIELKPDAAPTNVGVDVSSEDETTNDHFVRLVHASEHPAYRPFLDHDAHARAAMRLLQPGNRKAVIERILKLVYFRQTASGEKILCISSEEKNATEQRDVVMETPRTRHKVVLTPRSRARQARLQRRRNFRRAHHRMAIVCRKLFPCVQMLVSVFVKPRYGRCFYVRAYNPKAQYSYDLPVAFSTAQRYFRDIVISAVRDKASLGPRFSVTDALSAADIPSETGSWNEATRRHIALWIARAVWIDGRSSDARLRLLGRGGPVGPRMKTPNIWPADCSVDDAIEDVRRDSSSTSMKPSNRRDWMYRTMKRHARRCVLDISSTNVLTLTKERAAALPWFDSPNEESRLEKVRALMQKSRASRRELGVFNHIVKRSGFENGCKLLVRATVRLAQHPSNISRSNDSVVTVAARRNVHGKGPLALLRLYRSPPRRLEIGNEGGRIDESAELLQWSVYFPDHQRRVEVEIDTFDIDALFKGDGVESILDDEGLVVSPHILARRFASERLSMTPSSSGDVKLHIDRTIYVTEKCVKIVVSNETRKERGSGDGKGEDDDASIEHVAMDITDDMLFSNSDDAAAFMRMGQESARVARKMKRKSFVATNAAGGAKALHQQRQREKANAKPPDARRLEITVCQLGLELRFVGRILMPRSSDARRTRMEVAAAANDWENRSRHVLETRLRHEISTEFCMGFRGLDKTPTEREATLLEVMESLVLVRDRGGWLHLRFEGDEE